jgi:hypothetical protein
MVLPRLALRSRCEGRIAAQSGSKPHLDNLAPMVPPARKSAESCDNRCDTGERCKAGAGIPAAGPFRRPDSAACRTSHGSAACRMPCDDYRSGLPAWSGTADCGIGHAGDFQAWLLLAQPCGRIDVVPNIIQHRFAWLPSVLFLEPTCGHKSRAAKS